MKDANGKDYKVTMAVQLSELGQMTTKGWVLLAIVKDTIVERRNPITNDVVSDSWPRLYDHENKPVQPVVVTRSLQMAVIGRDEESALAEAEERVQEAKRETYTVKGALEDLSRKFAEADLEWSKKKESAAVQKELTVEINRLKKMVEEGEARLRAVKRHCGERDVADALKEAGLY